MNTNDYQLQSRRFLRQAVKALSLFASILILGSFTTSHAQKRSILLAPMNFEQGCPSYADSVVQVSIEGGQMTGNQISVLPGARSLSVVTKKEHNLIIKEIKYDDFEISQDGTTAIPKPQPFTPNTPDANVSITVYSPGAPGRVSAQKPARLSITLACGAAAATPTEASLTISLDRPAANQLSFTQGDDFPISGRVTRNSQGVAGVTVKLDFTSPRNSTAVGTPKTLTTDANGSFAWPAYFTADAAVGNWFLTFSTQIIGSNEKSAPVRRDFTVKKLELTAEQVNQNMRNIIALWKADPSIPNGIEQPFIEELWRPRGPKVNFREWRNSAKYKPFTCSELTKLTLRFLNGLRFHPTDKARRLLLGGVDYGPVTDGTGNIHVAVALFPHEDRALDYDWTTGYVLEPWWEQKKEDWWGTTWNAMFLGTDVVNGMGELGNFWKGEYPTSGSRGDYRPNPELIPYSITGTDRVAVLTYSPVEDVITDSQGRRVGRLPNGAFVKEIPDAQQAHAVLNDGTFLNFFVVPSGQYRVMVRGTGSGTFHLMTTSTTETMSYGEQPIAAGQEVTFTLNSGDLKQPLMLSDGRQVMPRPIGPEGSEAAAGGGSAGGPVNPQGGARLPGPLRPPSSSGIGGTWTAPTGDIIELIQNGNRITGRYRGILGTGEITGTFDGKNLSATVRPNQALLPLAIPLTLTLMEDGNLSGRLETPLASGALVFTRTGR